MTVFMDDNNTASQFRKLKNLWMILSIFLLLPNAYAQKKTITAVPSLELDRYLGVWYEIAHKSSGFLSDCVQNTQVIYTINVNRQIVVENDCIDDQGQMQSIRGEAFIVNPPHNSKFKISFLPEVVRWLTVGRDDYWVLKIDDHYQTALVGDPKHKYLWILSRQPTMPEALYDDYVRYAQKIGYQTQDLIRTKHTEK